MQDTNQWAVGTSAHSDRSAWCGPPAGAKERRQGNPAAEASKAWKIISTAAPPAPAQKKIVDHQGTTRALRQSGPGGKRTTPDTNK